MRTPRALVLFLLALAACRTTAETTSPDLDHGEPGGLDWQVSPLVGARWIVSPGHAYHAVEWTNGDDSRRTADLLGSFGEGPKISAGLNVVAVPAPGQGDFAPYGVFTWSSFELDGNRWDFNWEVYTIGGGVRWLFVHTRPVSVYALADLSLSHAIGEGEERVFQGVRRFDLEAQSFTGGAAGIGLGTDLFVIDALGMGVQTVYRYHRAGGIYYGSVDGNLNVIIRF